MKKTILTIAVLYGIAALGTPYFIGDKIEENIQHFLSNPALKQQLAMQGIDLSLTQYNKGYFSSTADIHLNVHTPAGTLYNGNFKANIKHAPLSLSGINAVDAHITGDSKPTGEIGDHVPQDFITINAQQSLLNLISGKHAISNELILSPVNTVIEGDTTLDFKGADMHVAATQEILEDVKITFNGLTTNANNSQRHTELKPFTITAKSDSATTATFTLDQLDYAYSAGERETVNIGLTNLREHVTILATGNQEMPYLPSAFGITFDQWTHDSTKHDHNTQLNIKDGDFRIGFIPDGDNQAFHFILKAKPTFGSILAPVELDNIDINIHIAPFNHDILARRIPQLFIAAATHPDDPLSAIGTQFSGLILENAATEAVTATVDAVIDEQAGKLFSAKGEIHEHIQAEADMMNIMFDPPSSMPKYFHGSKMNVFFGKTIIDAYLDYLTRFASATGQPTPQIRYLDSDGNMTLDVNVSDNQVLLNGKPAPF